MLSSIPPFELKFPCPKVAKESFIETATDVKIANTLLSLSFVAAASFSGYQVEKFARKQCSNNDLDFIEALQSIKQNYLLYENGRWNVHTLNYAGQCLLEAGYISDMDCVKQYQKKIGAKSMFSPNYIAESESIRARPVIAGKRRIHSQASVVEAGVAMITHMNNLREQ